MNNTKRHGLVYAIRVFMFGCAVAFVTSASFVYAEDGAHAEGAHAEDAHAEGDGHGATGWRAVVESQDFWAALVNFLLLVFLIVKFSKKPAARFLDGRQAQVKQSIEEAARLKLAAEAKHKEYEAKLQRLEQEFDQMKADMIKAGQAERDRIVGEAESKAARIRKETEFVIEQQFRQLRVDMTREATRAAMKSAEQYLREHTSADDHRRIADGYLHTLAAKPAKRGQA